MGPALSTLAPQSVTTSAAYAKLAIMPEKFVKMFININKYMLISTKI